jgi:hypothetical protein
MLGLNRLRILTVIAVVAVGALDGGPALADPPSGTLPQVSDAVGVGADASQYLLDQLGYNWDGTTPPPATKLYSWDEVNPDSLATGDLIVPKSGCAAIARPEGSGASIAVLDENVEDPSDTHYYCEDYAPSSAPRTPQDPSCATGGICFVALAGDAVTWADRDAAAGGTDAPASLTPAQLASIYECTDTHWNQVGGKKAPIEAYLPQTDSGTRSFFLTALGGGTTPITPGSCVSDLPENGYPAGTLQENEGLNPALDSAEAIYIYSVGDYIAQAFHSAACTNSGCSPAPPGQPLCQPDADQNKFGCDETGVLQLGEISKIDPLTDQTPPTINTTFPLPFQNTLFDVVRYDPGTADHIPGGEPGSPGSINLEQFFSADGFACSEAETTTIEDYGFLSSWLLSSCGAVN